MSSAVVAGTTSTSCFPTFSKNQSLKTTSTKSFISSHHQVKFTEISDLYVSVFPGLSLQDGRRGCSEFFMPNNNCSAFINVRTGLQVTARTAGAAKTIEVEVDKPLGLTLGQKSGGGVVITGVEGGGNAAKAGLKAGDQVLYTSSFFGDELWPADKLGFTKTAIQAKPDSIYFVVSRCSFLLPYFLLPFICGSKLTEVQSLLQNRGAEVDVKRLPKRPAPPRFGRKLTETQKACFFSFFFPFMSSLVSFCRLEQLTYALIVDSYTPYRNLLMSRHVCPLCIEKYTSLKTSNLVWAKSILHCSRNIAENRFLGRRDSDQLSTSLHPRLFLAEIYLFFSSCFMQPDAYVCPQCRAPKKRFARYDVNTGRAVGGGLPPVGVILGLVAGIGAVGALLVYGLQ
ncbi:hypothetical protein SADUNF_Sadunf19G0048500 [Salix dunnii]|uniref:PDZ domain-containing protein n=1 Tax=Salix dunnii TaxID=1413687 RepID=A0A835J217_9ROSI|nr:hypothetical protein SADUNF_Sadunf19G0048500 [Salix dunnii]